jgi:general stress protein 26
MKSLQTSAYVLSALIFFLPFSGFGQNKERPDSINNTVFSAAREIMISAKTCALISLDPEGRPRVRTMDPFPPENDFTVWFGTTRKSRKVSQIENDPRVTLYYLENDESGYVMIYGHAQIVNNQNEKEKRWKVEWEAFYPNKDEDYILIKVSPEWMEVVSYAHGLIGDPETWSPPSVNFKSK